MTEHISYARSGEPIVSLEETCLHSRYDPRAEALRYISSLSIDDRKSVFLFLEPGLGYACAALRSLKPECRILVAHCSLFYKADSNGERIFKTEHEWFPDGAVTFEKFLESHILDQESEFVKIIDWKPSIKAYGSSVLALASIAASFLKRASANARTVAKFGAKWFRNAVFMASRISTELTPIHGDAPIAVAASGPGLEESLGALKTAQEKKSVFIIAVSSAVSALSAAGVRPDLVAATDGGGWALFHLQDAIREQLPLALSFSAAIPAAAFGAPILPVRDLSRWQELVSSAARISAFPAPQRGTVAATAIDLALHLSSGPVYLAGFDLGVRGGRTHAKPNALDRFHEDNANRVKPSFSSAFERFIATKNGQSLNIYADWMVDHLRSFSQRIIVLGPASIRFNTFHASTQIDPIPGSVLPAVNAAPCSVRDALVRKRWIIESLEERIRAEVHAFSENEHERNTALFEGSALGELVQLSYPDDFSDAARTYRNAAVPLQLVRDFDEKIQRVLTEIS